jgi:hypothetical protein
LDWISSWFEGLKSKVSEEQMRSKRNPRKETASGTIKNTVEGKHSNVENNLAKENSNGRKRGRRIDFSKEFVGVGEEKRGSGLIYHLD